MRRKPRFLVALLASGQASTLTATLAGQIVMEGFLHIRLPAWLRRLVTRLLALVPALITIVWFGEESTGSLLVQRIGNVGLLFRPKPKLSRIVLPAT